MSQRYAKHFCRSPNIRAAKLFSCCETLNPLLHIKKRQKLAKIAKIGPLGPNGNAISGVGSESTRIKVYLSYVVNSVLQDCAPRLWRSSNCSGDKVPILGQKVRFSTSGRSLWAHISAQRL